MTRTAKIKIAAGSAIALAFVPIVGFSMLSANPPVGPVTPTASTPLDTGWTQTEVVGGLVHPWAAAWLPGDDSTVLITERPGRLRVVEDGVLRPEPVEGLPRIASVGQGGLMDIKPHPDFEDNRLIYFAAATGSRNANRTALFRGAISEDLTRLDSVEELYRVKRDKSGGQHFGAVIQFLDDGSLLLSIGDGGNPPVELDGDFIRKQAQNRETSFGKVLRMTDTGDPHPDNPYADGPGDAPFVYTYGHRNVQGLAIRPGTDEIWATEHGARGGDELNLIEPGNNYGWPEATYSIEYWGPRISDIATLEGAEDPRVVWTPCIAPCGLIFYSGD
ncbi:MAG: PQQ-dependent sugar dehydrogenase, partial [Planctomycetota bacterium]